MITTCEKTLQSNSYCTKHEVPKTLRYKSAFDAAKTTTGCIPRLGHNINQALRLHIYKHAHSKELSSDTTGASVLFRAAPGSDHYSCGPYCRV